jgi:hypothetical protein
LDKAVSKNDALRWDVVDEFFIKIAGSSGKIDTGMVYAIIFSQLNVHERERIKTRRQEARARS